MSTNGKTGKNGKPIKRWEDAFISALTMTGMSSKAAVAANVGLSTVYRERAENPDFAARWDQALYDSCAVLEEEARRRATDGVRKYKFHQGQQIMIPCEPDDPECAIRAKGEDGSQLCLKPYYEHDYSDTLLIALLNANNPEKFKYRSEVKMTGAEPQQGQSLSDLLRERLGSVSEN